MRPVITYLRSLFTLPARQPDWTDAVLTGLVFAVPMFLNVFLIQTEYLPFAAIIAVSVFAMAPRVSWFRRRVLSIVLNLGLAVVVAIVAGLAAPWPWSAALVMALVCFLSAIATAFGPAGIMMAALLPQVAIILLTTPTYYPHQVLDKAVIAFVAGCWATVVFLVSVWARNQFTARDALIRQFASLSRFAADPTSATQEACAADIEAVALQIAPPLFSSRHTSRQLEAAHRLTLVADALHRAISQARQRGESLPAEVTRWIDSVRAALGSGHPVPPPTPAVRQAIAPIDWDEPLPAAQPRLRTRLREAMSPGSTVMRHALRYSIAVLLAVLIAELTGIRDGWWIVLTVVVVLRAGMDDTVATMSRRVVGTLIGALTGSLLIELVGTQFVLMVVVSTALLTLAIAVRSSNYTYWTVCITSLVLLMLSQSAGTAGISLAGWRVVDTLIGTAIAAAAAFLLWPDRSEPAAQPSATPAG